MVATERVFRPWRSLRPEEHNVHFSDLDAKINRATVRFHITLRRILDEVKEKTIRKALQLEAPVVWEQLVDMTMLGDMRDYRRFLEAFFLDVYTYGKRDAARELGREVPALSAAFERWVTSKTQALTSLHAAILDFRTRNVVMSAPASPAARANFIRNGVAGLFGSFAERELDRGADLSTILALQAGRDETLADVYHEVVSFSWTGILDERICSICEILDKVTWARDDPTIIWPPIHMHDRCLLVATLQESEYKPEITGLPEGFELPESYQEFVQTLGRYHRD